MPDVAGTSSGTTTTSEKPIKYETRTITSVRGREDRAIAKWEAQGWEFVSQMPGKISTTITIRKPKPKTSWVPFAILGGVLVIGFTVLGIMAAIENANKDAAPAGITASEPADAAGPVEGEPVEEAPAEEAPVEEAFVEGAASTAGELTVGDNVQDISVDDLLDLVNTNGSEVGNQYRVVGTLVTSEYWFVGVTGDYSVDLSAQDGTQDVQVLLGDPADAEGWTDGTVVEFVVQDVEKTIDGETSGGWLQMVTAEVVG